MICYVCGKEVSSVINSKEGKICDLCNYLLTGKKKNPEADYSIRTKEGIVLWIKDLKVTSAWVNSGMTSIGLEHLKKVNATLEPIKVISFLTKLIERKEVFCSGCGETISRDKIAGGQFAGVFCETCWERFKKAHSRKCGICGSSLYRCCC